MDEHNTEILKVWVIPGNSEVVNENGITISPRRGERFKIYENDPLVYNKTFQDIDIKEKPEFRNTTKPKVSNTCLTLRKMDLEYQKELDVLKAQPPSMSHITRTSIEYSTPIQKIVLLSIAKVAHEHKLPLEYNWVINYCLRLAEEYNFSYVSFRNVRDTISIWSTRGIIKTKYTKIKAINVELKDIEEIILQDPLFVDVKDLD